MMDTTNILEHMEVLGSDGQHVGTVDGLEPNSQVRLTKSDPAAGGRHHWISVADIDYVDTQVHLKVPADEVQLKAEANASA